VILTFRQELVHQMEREVPSLAQQHADELDDGMPADVCWDRLWALEEAGLLRLFTAREDGRLRGYAAFVLGPDTLRGYRVVAALVVTYLAPAARRGLAGLRFLRFAEKCLAEDGADEIHLTGTRDRDLGPLFARMGYEPSQTIWRRELV